MKDNAAKIETLTVAESEQVSGGEGAWGGGVPGVTDTPHAPPEVEFAPISEPTVPGWNTKKINAFWEWVGPGGHPDNPRID